MDIEQVNNKNVSDYTILMNPSFASWLVPSFSR